MPDRESVLFVRHDGSILIMTAQYQVVPHQGLYVQQTINALYPRDARTLVSHAVLTAETGKSVLVITADYH